MPRKKRKARPTRRKAKAPKPIITASIEAKGPGTASRTSNQPDTLARNRPTKTCPLSLTPQAVYLVPGHPVVTRPEDAVANCCPGLELDIRNLDRRFFPGL